MKKLFSFILIICISANLSAQTTEAVDKQVEQKLAQFAKNIDSIKTATVTKTGTFFIDTIKTAVNTMVGFEISLTGFSKTNKVKCVKAFWVSNTDGIYAIHNVTTDKAYTGLTGGNIEAVPVSNEVLIKITSSPTVPITYTYKRFNL